MFNKSSLSSLTPDFIFHDPCFVAFTGLDKEHSESDFENALLDDAFGMLPLYIHRIELPPGEFSVTARIIEEESSILFASGIYEIADIDRISSAFKISSCEKEEIKRIQSVDVTTTASEIKATDITETYKNKISADSDVDMAGEYQAVLVSALSPDKL